MNNFDNYKILSLLAVFILILSACGGAQEDTIATAVAMTVAAQETGSAIPTATAKKKAASSTPTPGTAPTETQSAPPTVSVPPPSNGVPCLRANLVGETIPDGTIFKPGETFLKTWRIQNNGSCTWNSSYKIVYWDGDLIGGLSEYPFTGQTGPGEIAEISIFLKAPDANGPYKGYWKLISEWGGAFGVGEYDAAFYVQINVSDSKKPGYGITSVTYNLVRDPITGCPTNTWYTVYATISTNGPVDVTYRWNQSDGNESSYKTIKFTEASSVTVKRQWSLHLGVATNPRWFELETIEPVAQEWGKATFHYTCQ